MTTRKEKLVAAIHDRGAHIAIEEFRSEFGSDSSLDLGGVDLSTMDLVKTDLSRVNLSGANLFVAYLADADLSNSSLVNTCLRGARMSGAKLVHACLHEADLRGADLSGAKVVSVSMVGAKWDSMTVLTGADLSHSDLGSPTYQPPPEMLATVKGLETAHNAHSWYIAAMLYKMNNPPTEK